MLTVAKPVSCHSGEVSTGDLLGALAEHSGKPLIFSYEGHEVLRLNEIEVFPEPAGAGLLGVAGLLTLRRRAR